MDWEAERLLEDLEDDRAREARRKLLDELHGNGMSVEELRRRRGGGQARPRPGRPGARLRGALHGARDRRAGGRRARLPDRQPARARPARAWSDARIYGEKDLEAAQLGTLHRQAGFDDADALEVARVLGQGMARYAEARARSSLARSSSRASTNTSSPTATVRSPSS